MLPMLSLIFESRTAGRRPLSASPPAADPTVETVEIVLRLTEMMRRPTDMTSRCVKFHLP
jgi:hypothetical protein